MPSLIIVKLIPTQPTKSSLFRKALDGLSIDAYDLTVEENVKGVKIGSASNNGKFPDGELKVPKVGHLLFDDKAPAPGKLVNSILQDYPSDPHDVSAGILAPDGIYSVGTAVIVVTLPAGHLEYQSLDIRLEIKRNGLSILDNTIDYNIDVVQMDPLLPDQRAYTTLSASTYLALPMEEIGLDASSAFVQLNPNGQPPDFEILRKAVNAVLDQDHPLSDEKNMSHLELRSTPLTAAQCGIIASEITWNRKLYPIPTPTDSLYEMYTVPRKIILLGDTATDMSSDDQTKVENARKQFEGDLQAYHTTHDADAAKLAVFVFAASAAAICERMSAKASLAGFTFPVEAGDSQSSTTAYPEATVVLQYHDGATQPRFIVPAAYFYALGASYPMQVSASQRYNVATMATEDQLLNQFQASIDGGVLSKKEASITDVTGPVTQTDSSTSINLNQAARRLVALGSITGPLVSVATVDSLLNAFLLFDGLTTNIDNSFWAQAIATDPGDYLTLLLQAITLGESQLVKMIMSPKSSLHVSTVHDLVTKTSGDWLTFFQTPGTPASPAIPATPASPAKPATKEVPAMETLLPDFTLPGNVEQRTSSFVQRLRKFFTVNRDTVVANPQGPSSVGSFGQPSGDILLKFISVYNGLQSKALDFGSPLDAATVEQALAEIFPDDADASAWFKSALEMIQNLVQITYITSTNLQIDPSLQFSFMEALYARGFTSVDEVNVLTEDQFQKALAGTIAYPSQYASAIYSRCKLLGSASTRSDDASGHDSSSAFTPVNPDGSLTDYIPSPNLSPLGMIAYLHDILSMPVGSTTLGNLVAMRRGPLQSLSASMANLETTLPCIDLVNESLEALGGSLSTGHGAVFDTDNQSLAGFPLDSSDASFLFDAIPEHSSPSMPVASSIYEVLKKYFTAPSLPYSQGLDVCSSNLAALEVSRFDTMRHFRKDITELPIDAGLEPKDFQRYLWRYPVRLEIALEYLHITPEEYAALFSSPVSDEEFLKSLLGLNIDMSQPSIFSVLEFLKITGLSYREFLDLWRSNYVPFKRELSKPGEKADSTFPDRELCDLGKIRILFDVSGNDVLFPLHKLFVFIRLWRCLRHANITRLSFGDLAEICDVLHLFNDKSVNGEFLRQLAAFLMLREHFHVPFKTPESKEGYEQSPPKETRLLALWIDSTSAPTGWHRAVNLLLEYVEKYAQMRYTCQLREPGFRKDLKDNLHQLSLLAGFTEGDTWFAQPTSTLRFAEVLSKVYASEFTVGEIIFLFTVNGHLQGDDPFPLPDGLESVVEPLKLPEGEHSIWKLREKLVHVKIEDDEIDSWTWLRIEAALEELGFVRPEAKNTLISLGEHFFPGALEACGHPVSHIARRFAVDLPTTETTVSLWSADQRGPFRYDSKGAGQLWIELPLSEDSVLDKLSNTRQLNEKEIIAVQDLYFAPRSVLAPFAAIFSHFQHAIDKLVHEPSQEERFSFFQRQFAVFHRRCEVVAEHLAEHVSAATGGVEFESRAVAWHVIRSMLADENRPLGESWESDSGEPPKDYAWKPHLSGNAFAALLGLAGTGLLGEYQIQSELGDTKVWRQVTGDLTFFGEEQNQANVPVPTVLPPLDLKMTSEQQDCTAVVNGFGMRDRDEQPLGGAQPFRVCWTGALFIDKAGEYSFHVGYPCPGAENPDFDRVKHHRWLMVLHRGQKSWTMINHCWEAPVAPPAVSEPLWLHRGVYHIEIYFEQRQPDLVGHHHLHTGFQVKYKGADTEDELCVVPAAKLFLESKSDTLGHGLSLNSSAATFLDGRYTSTLRDIRRTYQRAFKGLLFACRYDLSAKPFHHEYWGESELHYILHHPASFMGTSYYRASDPKTGFQTHHAFLNVNFLPVADPYYSPETSDDVRAHPTEKRQAALFDWWERTFDYCRLRRWVRDHRNRNCWMLFYEATEQSPQPDQLLRYLGVNTSLAPLVLNYFEDPKASYGVSTSDLTDERWAMRVWGAAGWLHDLKKRFFSQGLEQARPWLWSSDDPNVKIGDVSGNQNLTHFLQKSSFGSKAPRAYGDIKRINDGLRERTRKALFAYLCDKNRVPLPFGPGLTAQCPRDLSDLLLQDVEVGIREKSTRIEDALLSVQTFVYRVRLGLEPELSQAPAFIQAWEAQYATFKIWKAAKRRQIYPENWIHWDELHKARKSEAFRSLEKQLKRDVLTVPKTGGLVSLPNGQPKSSDLLDLQSSELLSLTLASQSSVGLPLLGQPEHDGQQSLIASFPTKEQATKQNGTSTKIDEKHSPNNIEQNSISTRASQNQSFPPESVEQIPLWVKAAVNMGTQFIRVAAASVPAAIPHHRNIDKRCSECSETHAPVVDEYYFWLTPSQYYIVGGASNKFQNLDLGSTPPDPSCDWDPGRANPDGVLLKNLLRWNSQPMVHLNWCKIHFGRFNTPRRSDEGAPLASNVIPDLVLVGRKADSLIFSVANQESFRYDMFTDSAVLLSQDPADNPTIDTSGFPPPLTAYPFFIYFEPGAPLIPPSNFSTALTVAGTLASHGRLEESLKWYELAFDSPCSPLQRNNSWELATKEKSPPTPPQIPTSITSLSNSRNRAALLAYLETLLRWGENLASLKSADSSRRALIIFNLVSKVLGEHPSQVIVGDTPKGKLTIEHFIPSATPLNPRLIALYDRVANGLDDIHQFDGTGFTTPELSLERRTVSRTLFSPHRRHPYRFCSLLPQALELADAVRSLGASLLSAFEKGDAEYLSSLQATHERQLLDLTLEPVKHRFREADWEVQALEQSLEKSLTSLTFTQNNIKNGKNAGEIAFETLTGTAMGLRAGAEGSLYTASAEEPFPDVFMGEAGAFGSPLIFQMIPGGTKLAATANFVATALTTGSDLSNMSANLSLTEAGWDRRMDDWQEQVDETTIELKSLECQKLAADRRRYIALRELNSCQQQIEHAVEVQDFMRDKLTDHDLYLFLQQETMTLYRQTYDLALQAAHEVQEMFYYERRDTPRDFLPKYAWDNLQEGLMAGERLSLALQTMDRAYMEANVREYELTKQLSLSMHFPTAFLLLKMTGSCEIDIPEWMFDLDYPGHYMRRIKNVSLTIPCVVGPYTGIHCRLQLLSSRIRIYPSLPNNTTHHLHHHPASAGSTYTAQSPTDPRFTHLYGAREAITTSTGISDSGLFELSFRDERYLPFEFAGAVSRWRIELPAANNAFELESLTDVVLGMNFTAREGGEGLRSAAAEAARQKLPGDGWRLLDLRREFGDAWGVLVAGGRKGAGKKHSRADFQLQFQWNMFPFLSGRREVKVVRLHPFIQVSSPKAAGAHIKVFYYPPGYDDDDEGRGEIEYHYSTRGGKVQEVNCVVHDGQRKGGGDLGLYHGAVDVEIKVPSKGQGRDGVSSVKLKFPEEVLCDVRDVYLLCQYEVRDRRK
jgi:hypothetical protein